MLQKIIKSLVYSIVLLLPLYLVRFSIFGIPTNLIEFLVIIAFLLWIFEIKILPFLKGPACRQAGMSVGQRDFYGNAIRYIAKIIKVKIPARPAGGPPAPFTKREGLALTHSIPKIYWLSFLLLFLGLTISAILNPNFTREAGIIKGWFVAPFLFFLIIVDRFESVEKTNKLIKLLFVSSATVGLVSLVYLLTDNLTFDGRLQAFYLSPNHLAMFLTPGIVIGLFSVAKICVGHPMSKWTSDVCKRDISFYFPLLGSIIMLIALYCTFSYGAWMALFLSLLIALGLSNLLNRSQKIKSFLLTLGLLVALFSFQLPHQKLNDILKLNERSSLTSRMMIWESAWKIGKNNPIWGIGPGNFQDQYLAYQKYFPPYLEWAVPQPHNLYFAFWLQSGILGLAGFLLLTGIWIYQMAKALKNKKNNFEGVALLTIMLSILIHGLVDTPYWKNDLSLLFWIIIAISIAMYHKTPPLEKGAGGLPVR